MALEKSSFAQKTPRVFPLYLPEIYALLIENRSRYTNLLDFEIRQKWEQEFLACCDALKIVMEDIKPPFWTKDIAIAIDKNPKIGTQEVIWKSSGLLKLFKVAVEARVDQTYSSACEALGLIAYRGDAAHIQLDKPTKFFEDIISGSGAEAAIKLLGRLLSIPVPTIEDIVVAPAELLLGSKNKAFDKTKYYSGDVSDSKNKSLGTYALAIYSQAIHPWIPETFPSKNDAIPVGIIEMIPSISLKDKTAWRDELISIDVLDKITGIIIGQLSTKEKLSGIETEVLSSLKKYQLNNQIPIKPINVVLVGPPGTGKSHLINNIATKIISENPVDPGQFREYSHAMLPVLDSPNVYKVQFHPSYGYEDFIEGIRPLSNPLDPTTIRYNTVPGPFKAASHLARAFYDLKAVSTPEKRFAIPVTIFCTNNNLNHDGAPAGSRLIIPEEYSIYRFDKRDGSIFIKQENGTEQELFTGNLPTSFETEIRLSIGSYSAFWRPKITDKTAINFIIVIDELNRGNPSKIFGEVLSIIESSKRLNGKEPLLITLPSSKEEFGAPINLHLLCTMNLADRSLAALDQAFRRRFKFVYLPPDWSLIESQENYTKVTGRTNLDQDAHTFIAKHLHSINMALKEIDVSEDNFIGHSYAFQTLDDFYRDRSKGIRSYTEALWRDELHPIIKDMIGPRLDDFIKAYEIASKENKTIESNVLKAMLKNAYVSETNRAA